jgi:hypothetical protein
VNAQDEMELELWQELRHLPPAQRMQALDDQMRIDSLLKSCFAQVRADEYEEIQRSVSEIFACPAELKELSA